MPFLLSHYLMSHLIATSVAFRGRYKLPPAAGLRGEFRSGSSLRRFSAFAIASLLLAACCTSRFVPTPPHIEASQLRLTHSFPRGIIIVIHGLNQRPSSMDPIAEHLRSLGYTTLRLTLTGHDTASDLPFSATQWERDLTWAFTRLRHQFPDLPIHILGYSLGGLLTTRVLDSNPTVRPTSAIFLAPGLSLRILPQSAYFLSMFPPLTLSVRNLAPADYKRFAATPLFWYQNLIELYHDTRTLTSERPKQTPTLVIANPRDELVSADGLQEWIERNNLEPQWRLTLVRPQSITPLTLEHVIIDQRSLGDIEWQRLLLLIEQFLREHERVS